MRAAVLAVLLVLCGIGETAAETPADPVAYVRGIYRGYEQDAPRAWFGHRYSARLKKLIQADRKAANGEAGKFDWDPLINAQDWQLSAIRVSLVSQTTESAVVEVMFRNLGSDQHMRFDLVRQGNAWAIDDLEALDRPRWTMSKVLAGAADAFPDREAK